MGVIQRGIYQSLLLLHICLYLTFSLNDNTIKIDAEKARAEGMSVWVVSHGGVGSNAFSSYMESRGARVFVPSWRRTLCHAKEPVQLTGLNGAVYVFGDPLQAICSMKYRDLGPLNLAKLTNSKMNSTTYSDGALLEAMYHQFKSWTTPSASASASKLGFPIFKLRYEDAHDETCISKVAALLHLQKREKKLRVHKRRVKNQDACMNQLHASLTSKQKKMAQEIDSYRGDCRYLPQPKYDASQLSFIDVPSGPFNPSKLKKGGGNFP